MPPSLSRASPSRLALRRVSRGRLTLRKKEARKTLVSCLKMPLATAHYLIRFCIFRVSCLQNVLILYYIYHTFSTRKNTRKSARLLFSSYYTRENRVRPQSIPWRREATPPFLLLLLLYGPEAETRNLGSPSPGVQKQVVLVRRTKTSATRF